MIQEREVAHIAQMLPETSYLKNYLAYALRTADAPLAYALGFGLSHLATVVHRGCHFRLTTKARPNLFTLIVGPSGSRKTQAMMLGDEILQPVVGGRTGETPGSWEGLEEGLNGCPVQLHQYPEFGDFLAKSSTASTGGNYFSAIRQAYTKLYDCRDYSRRKAKGRLVHVRDPRLSIAGCSTLEFIEQHTTHEDWCGGFMGRFLVFHADRERTDFNDYTWPEQEMWLRRKLAGLYLQANGEGDTIPVDDYQGRTAEAQKMWVAWSEEIDAMRQDASQWAASALSRLPVNTLKIATLLAMDYGMEGQTMSTTPLSAHPWQLDVDALAPAIAIVRLHYRSVCEVIDRLASSPYEVARRNVLSTLTYDTPRPIWTILQRLQPRMKLRVLQETLETLIAAREINRIDGSLGTVPLYQLRAPVGPVTGDPTVTAKPPPSNVVTLPQKVAGPVIVPDVDTDDDADLDWDAYLS